MSTEVLVGSEVLTTIGLILAPALLMAPRSRYSPTTSCLDIAALSANVDPDATAFTYV